jgi:hypothetical protein
VSICASSIAICRRFFLDLVLLSRGASMASTTPLALMFAMMASTSTAPAAIGAEGSDPQPTIRIHDYAKVPQPTITYTQRQVTKLYAAAGVSVRWVPPIAHTRERRVEATSLPEDLSVLILNRRMADHYTPSRDIAGFAAVADADAHGRIAYVFYDRVEAAVRSCQCPAADVLGLVVAHEIGHLLLPRGSHSELGIMRRRWHYSEFRRMDSRALRFTSVQAEQIRRRLRFAFGASD